VESVFCELDSAEQTEAAGAAGDQCNSISAWWQFISLTSLEVLSSTACGVESWMANLQIEQGYEKM
jgi:hypothetical protein